MEEVTELKRQGLSIRANSRRTGYDRKTIGRYLAEPSSLRCMREGAGAEQVGAVQVVSKGEASGGRVKRRGAFAGVARAQLPRRLHDSEGLAAPAAQASRVGFGRAVRDAAGQAGAGGLGPFGQIVGARPEAPAVGLHDDAGLQPADVRRDGNGSEAGHVAARARGGLLRVGCGAGEDSL